MRPSVALTPLLSAYFLTGCLGVATTNGHGMYYGGGSVSLFVLIIVLALLFGRRRR
jgi:hypothetical protein